jgi:hypothetical protein
MKTLENCLGSGQLAGSCSLSVRRFQGIIRSEMAQKPQNPPLSLVSPETAGILPPRPLGPHGMALWDRVQREYRVADTGGGEILAQACSALDRAESLAAAIERDGPVILTRTGVPKAHPACKDELACRAFIVRSLERLGLNVEAVKPGPGRPPTGFGWTGPRT